MSRRDQITMDDAEVVAFLDEERVMTCATLGARGWPHLMPLWYVVRESRPPESRPPRESRPPGSRPPGSRPPRLWAWTFAKSQKTRNLERDPRATLQVEAGRDQYSELRGVMLETEVTIHRDVGIVTDLGLEIFGRYGGNAEGEVSDEVRQMVEAQAAKRVGLEFVERSRATWDHRKLGNTY